MLLNNLFTHCCGMATHMVNKHLSQVTQWWCVGHSGMNNLSKLNPQQLDRVEVRTTGRSFHPLHSQILEVVSDKPCSVGASVVTLEDRVWSQTAEISVIVP
ncbi:hypothetical protein AMECASPLE_010532 [Ameca splendens]|uniref:Uncharacterized protein n=1 Tax=Ameca splendens TaxID=208324 RepID=A0ABV0XDK7_9TELE